MDDTASTGSESEFASHDDNNLDYGYLEITKSNGRLQKRCQTGKGTYYQPAPQSSTTPSPLRLPFDPVKAFTIWPYRVAGERQILPGRSLFGRVG
jgi:hypothetical protein